MGKTSSSHHPPADASHGSHGSHGGHGGHGHAEPVETAEQRADRERSASVELAWSRGLRKPAALLALLTGAVSLGWLATLGGAAPAMSWTWLLLLVPAFVWCLALAKGGSEEH